MAGRVSFLLRGVGNAFGLKISTAKAWESIADNVIRQHTESNTKKALIQ